MREHSHIKYILLALVLCIQLHLWGQSIPVLPEGKGLAGGYHSDNGIEDNKAVLFYDGFENQLGLKRWNHTWANGGSGEIIRPETELGANGRVYKAFINRPSDKSASIGIRKFLKPGYDTLFFRYYARYKTGIELFHGGTHNSGSIAARLSEELYESHAGVYPDGHNIYSIILDTWRPDQEVKSPGNIAFYCYHMDQGHQWGDHFFPSGLVLPGERDLFGDQFIPRPDFIPETGKWYCYEMMIQANTPGKRDGKIAFWVDGKLMGDFQNLRFRETESLKPNRIALSLYTHNQNNRSDLTMWFDDVVAATSYIGPKTE